MKIDEALKEWATPRQCEYIDAVNKYGSINAASRQLKIPHQNISEKIRAIKKRAALAG
jgi:molybdenum-dependent DNA-binding transcriptional regulator ModE